MSRSKVVLGGLAGALVMAFAACSASSDTDNSFTESEAAAGPGVGGAGSTGSQATTGNGAGGFNPTTTGTGGSTVSSCDNPPDADGDGDGWTANDGDCNNCDPNVNPGAIEVVTDLTPTADGGVPEPADENCDGQIDEVDAACDTGLAFDDADPLDGAKAIDLCKQATAGDKNWGVLSANYVRADGGPTNPGLQVGLFDSFGPNVNVQKGERMLSISSGYARLPSQPNACDDYSCSTVGGGTPPNGFPQGVPGCDGGTDINDDVALQLQLRAPTNATGYKFFFKFNSFEFPEYVCTNFNDQFIALVDPPPMGAINGNISFDSNSNPVSVNIAFFDACDPNSIGNFALYCFIGSCPAPPNPYCPSGTAQLQGNGFDGSWGQDAGATSWLQTTAPITGGEEFSIRFAIWDTGDTAWDSTALVDGFQWIANGGTGVVVVGTDPIPDPR